MAHGVLTRISNSITGGGWRARLATRRPYVVLATLLLLVLAGVVLFRRPEDWHKVYIPMGRWLLEGRDIYDVQSTGFTYPPAMALMALPFGLVPPLAARAAYILLSSASLITFWWLGIFIGMPIFLVVLAFNLVGDSIREILDPKLRRRRIL